MTHRGNGDEPARYWRVCRRCGGTGDRPGVDRKGKVRPCRKCDGQGGKFVRRRGRHRKK